MLRITIQNDAATTRFVIEGKLVGPWVRELEKCWRKALSAKPSHFIQVHLANVFFVDERGKELLVAMHKQGVGLVANGMLTQAIVKEIVQGREEESR